MCYEDDIAKGKVTELDTCEECSGKGKLNLARCSVCGEIAEKVKDGVIITESKIDHRKKQVERIYQESKCTVCGDVDVVIKCEEECLSCDGHGYK